MDSLRRLSQQGAASSGEVKQAEDDLQRTQADDARAAGENCAICPCVERAAPAVGGGHPARLGGAGPGRERLKRVREELNWIGEVGSSA